MSSVLLLSYRSCVTVEREHVETFHSRFARKHHSSSIFATMDAVAGLLDGARAQGAFLLRSVMEPPWAIRIEDRAPLSLMAMVRGEAWVIPATGDPVLLRPGDIAVMRGPDPYTVADDPHTPAQIVIHPGQRLHDARRDRSVAGDGSRGQDVGERPRRIDGDAHRHLRGRLGHRSTPARRIAGVADPPSRHVGQSTGRVPRRRDRQGRARPGGRPRPAARPARHRRDPGLVLPPRCRGSGLVPGAHRPGRRQGAPHAAQQPGPSVDRGRAGGRERHLAAPPSPVGSPISWANRR